MATNLRLSGIPGTSRRAGADLAVRILLAPPSLTLELQAVEPQIQLLSFRPLILAYKNIKTRKVIGKSGCA
jgi:hypothetical protein